MAREPFWGLDRISGFWSLQKAVLKHVWPLAQNHYQNTSKLWRASHFSVQTEYLVFGFSRKPIAQNHYQVTSKVWRAAILGLGPNIWFLESPEGRFEVFLAPCPKPLPEHLKTMAREPFFGPDRISGFWTLQKGALKHFCRLAQNHCQNTAKLWRASHFSVWT